VALQRLDNMARLPPAYCTKIFLQRDYSDGTAVRFQTKFPQELEGKVLFSASMSFATQSFDKHVVNIVLTCIFHTRVLRHMRPIFAIDVIPGAISDCF